MSLTNITVSSLYFLSGLKLFKRIFVSPVAKGELLFARSEPYRPYTGKTRIRKA